MVALSNNNPFQSPTSTAQSAPPDVHTFDEPAEATWKDLPLWCTSLRIRRSSAVARHRYPNVPGQTIEPMGREPIEVQLETSWFGEDWRDRLENLAYTKDIDQTSGRLVLPDGRGVFDAYCVEMSEDQDLGFSGAVVTLSFEEDAHVDAYIVASMDALSAADADIPTSGPGLACRDSFDEYQALCTSTSTSPVREAFAALNTLEANIATAQAACDVMTTDGIADFLALGRVQYRARAAFPDQDFLVAALTA
jgi:hypothetical protein